MQIKQMIKTIEARQRAIGKERDKLDEVLAELGDLKDVCDRAYDYLRDARDALSELV